MMCTLGMLKGSAHIHLITVIIFIIIIIIIKQTNICFQDFSFQPNFNFILFFFISDPIIQERERILKDRSPTLPLFCTPPTPHILPQPSIERERERERELTR
ncbi:hypothetical protein HanRHA438_Chr09g0413311 [Helianthus annuus]|nr:hypothetical protein HanIR_Chr09g0432511 [Helianthus annuus]KAJ0889479.1 hypothetical protein HanRHA438_Chr09g0413311 [Helianthus annuus]